MPAPQWCVQSPTLAADAHIACHGCSAVPLTSHTPPAGLRNCTCGEQQQSSLTHKAKRVCCVVWAGTARHTICITLRGLPAPSQATRRSTGGCGQGHAATPGGQTLKKHFFLGTSTTCPPPHWRHLCAGAARVLAQGSGTGLPRWLVKAHASRLVSRLIWHPWPRPRCGPRVMPASPRGVRSCRAAGELEQAQPRRKPRPLTQGPRLAHPLQSQLRHHLLRRCGLR